MGLRGPAPTPTHQLELRGSWRANLNRREPRPEPGPPPCPPGLSADEKKVWRAVCRILADMDLLTKADGATLERYCRFFVRNGLTYPLKAPADEPPRGGYVGRLPSGEFLVAWVEFPQAREVHRLHKALKDIEDRFGLTPAARTRVQSMSEAGPKLHGAGVPARPKTKLDKQGPPA
jgi:P27 family predicted phage terminase small subunit